jgi:hypothetical protein
LDRYYFTALTRVMEAADETYVSGYKIWEHDIEWRERKSECSGYLFFGAPNERSTAQPPRDFYLYFQQPYDVPYFKDEKKPDEVFFRLKKKDDDFDNHLKLFAAAHEQAGTSSGENKKIYEQKAANHLQKLTKWLREHMVTAYEVTYEGRSKSLQEVIQGKVPGGLSNASVRDLVNIAGSVCLAPQFENKSPDYPIFSVLITRSNRKQSAGEALKWIAGGVKSKQGTAVLDALNLLDGNQLRPRDSRYATHVLDLLSKKKKGQVLNRTELIQDEDGIDYWTRFRLEPEFLAVTLASLVHSGALVLSIPGNKFGADSVDQFAHTDVSDLANFKHVEQPKGLQLEPLKLLFELLGLAKGKLVNESTRDQAVQDLQIEVSARVKDLVMAHAKLQEGLSFWGSPVLSELECEEWRSKLSTSKDFLESLQAFNTVGKLSNFPHDVDAVTAQATGLVKVKEVDDLVELIEHVGPQTSYLATAENVLPGDHPWLEEVQQAKTELLTKVTSPSHRADHKFQRNMAQTLTTLKTSYQDAYLKLHKKAHLGAKDDEKKAALTIDARLKQLQTLDAVEIMPHQQLQSFQDTLFGLKTCFALSRKDLKNSPVCPHSQFRPVESPPGPQSAAQILTGLDDQLDTLVNDWTQTLLNNLDDPTVVANIELISDASGKKKLASFIKGRELPEKIAPSFVKALQEALTGLEKVAVSQEDLQAALVEGGIPCTVDELKGRFDTYVTGLTKGKNKDKVRVVVE